MICCFEQLSDAGQAQQHISSCFADNLLRLPHWDETYKSHSPATRPRPAAVTQPRTDISDGLNTGVMETETPSPDRIPGTAIPSSPPTTTVTVDATAARDQSAHGQEPCQLEEIMKRGQQQHIS